MRLETGPCFYKFGNDREQFIFTGRYVMDQALKEGNFHTFYQRLGSKHPVKETGCRRIRIPKETSRLLKVGGLTRFIYTEELQDTIVRPTPPEEGRTPLVEEWFQKVLELDENYLGQS